MVDMKAPWMRIAEGLKGEAEIPDRLLTPKSSRCSRSPAVQTRQNLGATKRLGAPLSSTLVSGSPDLRELTTHLLRVFHISGSIWVAFLRRAASLYSGRWPERAVDMLGSL